jgi:hypothetical protein
MRCLISTGLIRGAGRMKESGFNIDWGVGRHGPGNNVLSYFIEPNGTPPKSNSSTTPIMFRSRRNTGTKSRRFRIGGE